MNATKTFKETIQCYLEERAAADELFAVTYKKEGKNIDDCITYILNTVKASGSNGFADDEIFGMAVHYYDEDNIKVGSPVNGKVIVNHKVDLTEEEKLEAKEKAKKQFEEAQLKDLQKSQERKEAREKKKQEKMKSEEAERKAKRLEAEKRVVMAQPTLF